MANIASRETREGRIAVTAAGHEIGYRLTGSGGRTLVGLHGGPGGQLDALLALERLAGDDLSVLLYDQLGGGRSDRPDDPGLWTVPRFVAELDIVRARLGLGSMHLLGRSWGGMLALQYALDQPGRVQALILSNTAASTAEILAGMDGLRRGLGPERYEAMLRHEAAGDLAGPEYLALLAELLAKHYRRIAPFELAEGIAAIEREVLPYLDHGPPFSVMWGPSEFTCTGSLRDWDVRDRLHELHVPTLILCGLHDEVTLDVHRALAEGIPQSEFVVFGNSSHTPLQEREAHAYLAVVADFVARAG